MIGQAIEIIARRNTADGIHVCLWADGSLTWAMGRAIKGAWFNPKPERREVALRAGWLALGEAELYDSADVPDLCRAARYAAERDGLPGTLRKRLFATKCALVPSWTTQVADRDGKPRERVWVLPRLGLLAGTAVFDKGHGSDRYQVWHRISGTKDSYEPSGFGFPTQAKLVEHLGGFAEQDARLRALIRR